MSSTVPTTEKFPLPQSFLRVDGDPTLWGLAELDVAPSLAAHDPVALEVVSPLAGTLLLAPLRAGHIAVSTPRAGPGGGWVPCVKLKDPYLCLPSTTGVAAHSPGYMLAAPDTDLETLKEAILAAMRDGTFRTVNVSFAGTTGVVLLNGAELPFVVLAAAEPDEAD
jgi:hypothetical protein